MRKSLCTLAAFGLLLSWASISTAQLGPKTKSPELGGKSLTGPIIRDHRSKPDLSVTSLFTAGELVQVNIVNRGGNGNNKPSQVRIRMYRTINGTEKLIATAFGAIPLITSGDFKTVTVRFPFAVSNCRLVGEIDFGNQIVEVNENDNRFQRTVK